MQNSGIAREFHGFLNPVTRHVLSGWAAAPAYARQPVCCDLESAKGDLKLRLSINRPTDGPTGRHRFICHLRQGLEPGDHVQGRMVETGELLLGSPREVSPLESVLALDSPAYDYLVYYSPKSACTWLRNLFAFLHEREAQGPIDPHNLQSAFPTRFDAPPATALAVVRDPTMRIISSFLDKVVSWVYQPQISRAGDVLEWRFGRDEGSYPQLTFLDFLTYLNECPYPGEDHFWPQPIYKPNVWIARVESLHDDILSFYAERRPALLDAVERFVKGDQGERNASRNTKLDRHIDRPGADTLTIAALADSIQSGVGIDTSSFLSDTALRLLDPLVSREREAYKYPAHR